MSNDIRKYNGCIETSDVRCYNHIAHPSLKNTPQQAKDTFVIDEHPYWNAFADGFVEGFSLPFVAAFSVLGMVGCDSGNRLAHYPNEDAAKLDAHGDTSSDGGSNVDGPVPVEDVAEGVDATILDGAELPPEDISVEDAADGAADLAGDVTDTDGVVTPPDMSVNDASDAEDAIQDAAADLSEDATAADGTELPPDISVDDTVQDAGADLADDATVADGIELPPDAVSVDAAADVVDDTSDAAAPICQYFCDAGISETDAALPADATPADDASPAPSVVSAICGPISAPANSVAVACTNMLQGAVSCVAECAFFDKSEMTFSTDPKETNKFYKTFGDIQFGFFVPYEKITWTAFAPLKPDNSPVAFPTFMGSANVYVFNTEKYNNTGMYIWETQDENSKFKKTDYLQLIYQPKDEFFNTTPEFLEQSQITSTGGMMTYRYPCDTLSNPQIQCTEVK